MAAQVEHAHAEVTTSGTTRKLSKNAVLHKGPIDAEASGQRKSEEKHHTTHKGTHTPKLSIHNTKSFDQQVKRAIEEAAHGSKAVLGKQLLQDQAIRISSTQPVESLRREEQPLSLPSLEKSAAVAKAVSLFKGKEAPQALVSSPSMRSHYTVSGRKLHDTSIQAVISLDKVGAPPNLANMGSGPKVAGSRRSLPSRFSGAWSPAPAGRVGLGKVLDGLNPSVALPKRTPVDSAPILVGSTAPGSKSKLLGGSKPPEVTKQTLRNVGPTKTPLDSAAGSEVVRESSGALPTGSKSIPGKSQQIPSGPRPLAEGSMQVFAGSRVLVLESESKLIAGPKLISKSSQEGPKIMFEESTKIPAGGMIPEESSKKMGISGAPPTEEIQTASLNVQSKNASLREEFSALMKKKGFKEPLHKIESFQSHQLLKHQKTNSQRSHHLTPGEVSQAVSGHLRLPSADSTKRTGQKLSAKAVLRNSTQRSSVSPSGMITSKEDSKSKVLQPTESLLEKMLMYCDCPDIEVLGEDEIPEIKFDFDSFKNSTENVNAMRPKIRSVARSPFERKDRAARAAFAKQLEQMEIAAIEKKQRLKPRKIKIELKKGGVYETLKNVCNIPDSFADSLRGSPSRPSMETGASPQDSAHSSHSESEGSGSPSSSIIEDKIQLRKDNSLGSRATGAGLTREDAFHEIELSEESDTSHHSTASSSSSCEIISSSSEISLRVNLEKTFTPDQFRRKRSKNAPFVNYQNKVNAELMLAEENKSVTKILDSNLEGIIIEKIATEFGEWAKENGVKPEAVEKDVIKELFQFGTMDTAANSIAVEIKELIIVPESITDGMYPELEERAAIYRQILFDEGAYWRTERSMAFGKPDPKPYKRPPHPPLPTWTESGFVPQPLATGELLYKTLIDNDSLYQGHTEGDPHLPPLDGPVEGFYLRISTYITNISANMRNFDFQQYSQELNRMLERYVLWMVENPKHYRPPYLLKCGYFQKIVDRHGGSEEAIRQKSATAKLLSSQTGKNMRGLNFGMQNDLRKLKDMSEAGKKPKAQG